MSVREDLKAYVDGQLPPMRMQEVREALEANPELAREAAELQALSVAIKSSEPAYVPRGLDDTLRRLHSPAPPRWWWFGLPLGLASAVALAIVMLNRPDAEDRSSVAFESQRERNSMAASAAAPSANGAVAQSKAAPSFDKATVEGPSANGSVGLKVPELNATRGTKQRAKERKLDSQSAGPSTEYYQDRISDTARAPANPAQPSKAKTRPEAQEQRPASTLKDAAALALAVPTSENGKQETIVLDVDSPVVTASRLRQALAPYQGVAAKQGFDRAAAKEQSDSYVQRLVFEVPEVKAKEAAATIRSIGMSPPMGEAMAKNVLSADAARLSAGAGGPGGGRGAGVDSKYATARRDQSNLAVQPQGVGGGGFGGGVGGGFRAAAGGKINTGHVEKAPDVGKASTPKRTIVVVIRQRAQSPKVEKSPVPKSSGPGNLEP